MEFKEIKTHTNKKNTCIQTTLMRSPLWKHREERGRERERKSQVKVCAHNKIYVAYNLYFGIINHTKSSGKRNGETIREERKKSTQHNNNNDQR